MIVVFPAPVCPTNATVSPGLDRERDVLQHPLRFLAVAVVL